jgi:hypothetical protein
MSRGNDGRTCPGFVSANRCALLAIRVSTDAAWGSWVASSSDASVADREDLVGHERRRRSCTPVVRWKGVSRFSAVMSVARVRRRRPVPGIGDSDGSAWGAHVKCAVWKRLCRTSRVLRSTTSGWRTAGGGFELP